MASRITDQLDLRERLGRSLETWREPGAAELCALLEELLGDVGTDRAISLEPLKQEVYRLRIGGEPRQAVVLKRLRPAIAQTDRLVVERWLPALGLGDRAPRLLGAAASRDGSWIWHVYEDLGHETLAVQREPEQLAAAVDVIAEIHTRAAFHPLLPEVRWRARDHGAHFFTSNVCDAIATLEALSVPARDGSRDFAAARARLLRRLHELLDQAPRRVCLMHEAGGPDTLLHGDLWPKNVFVSATGNGPRARLIDWDHVGVGPFSYDLSTFLYRSSVEERPWILQQYRGAVERAGRPLSSNAELNLLFHTAESARYAHCILFDAMAVVHDGAEWAIEELMDYDEWLDALRPPLVD
jgi:hypothetical protein